MFLRRVVPLALGVIWAGIFGHVALAAGLTLAPPAGQDHVEAEGAYGKHLQGICTNGTDAIYWSFTNELIKTDTAGKVVKSVPVLSHHGDLTYVDGLLYVAVNDVKSDPPGEFNAANPINPRRQWVYKYNADTLAEIAKYPIPDLIYGAGAIGHRGNRFFVAGGLPRDQQVNRVYEYDPSFKLVKTHMLHTGQTFRGIQTIEFAHGHWWFGTYESLDGKSRTRQLLKYNESLSNFSQYTFDASLGIAALLSGHFLIGKNRRNDQNKNVGRAELAALNAFGQPEIVPIPAAQLQQDAASKKATAGERIKTKRHARVGSTEFPSVN